MNTISPNCKFIKGYDIVRLTRLQTKLFKKNLVLLNGRRYQCLMCGSKLEESINFVPINESQGLRIPGQYCTQCNTFYDPQGHKLKNLSAELKLHKSCEINSEYLIPDYWKKVRAAQAVKSASFAVALRSRKNKKHRFVTVVSACSDKHHNQDVFHYSDLFIRQLLCEIYKRNSAICISNEMFDILKIISLDGDHYRPLDHLKIDKIILRSGGGLYNGLRQSGIELVDILLYSPFTDCLEVSHASFDIKNAVYYMDSKVFRNFIMKYGNPGVKIAAYQSTARDFSTMQEESILHAYGYVVGNNGLPDKKRQELLGEVIDLGIMSAHSIISLIGHNISMHPGKQYENARTDWEMDRQFVLEYKVNPNRFVVSTIGL